MTIKDVFNYYPFKIVVPIGYSLDNIPKGTIITRELQNFKADSIYLTNKVREVFPEIDDDYRAVERFVIDQISCCYDIIDNGLFLTVGNIRPSEDRERRLKLFWENMI